MKRTTIAIACLLVATLLLGCGVAAQTAPGEDLATAKGCLACHAIDATEKVGPTWVGLAGSQVELDDGTTLIADDAYLKESILEPNAKIVAGYSSYMMPAIPSSDQELDSLLAFIKSVK